MISRKRSSLVFLSFRQASPATSFTEKTKFQVISAAPHRTGPRLSIEDFYRIRWSKRASVKTLD